MGSQFRHLDPLGQRVELIGRAGLVIEALVEPCASPELAAAEPLVADTRLVPQALLVRARKRDATGG